MRRHKPYWEMTREELAQATRQYDRPGRSPRFLAAPGSLQREHDRIVSAIRRKRGRPVIGEGSQRIQVTMERGLLRQVDGYARRYGISRAQLLAIAARAVLANAA